MLKQLRSEAGDTIIEVMIALAVIGAVIGTSYAISSRSLKLGRQAQERTEALKLVESQVELLKSAADAKNTDIFTSLSSESFCLATSGAGITFAKNNAVDDYFGNDSLVSKPTNEPDGNPDAGQIYNYACAQGVSLRYKMSISRVDDFVVGNSKFTVRARWEKLGGGKDEVSLDYKLHKGLYQ